MDILNHRCLNELIGDHGFLKEIMDSLLKSQIAQGNHGFLKDVVDSLRSWAPQGHHRLLKEIVHS